MRIGSPLGRVAVALGAVAVAASVTGCTDDDGTDIDSAFCEEVRAREDAFEAEGASDVPPTLVGALRELVEDADAPDAFRDAFEQLTEATSDDDLDDALAQIDEALAGCGVDMEG